MSSGSPPLPISVNSCMLMGKFSFSDMNALSAIFREVNITCNSEASVKTYFVANQDPANRSMAFQVYCLLISSIVL